MTAPASVVAPAGPSTVDAVSAWLGANDPNHADEQAHIAAVVPAVNRYIRSYTTAPADGQPWDADLVLGAVMLAARNVRRRNSPAGVETVGDMGAVYVSRFDRDLDQLLRLGDFRRLVIG